ncbi:Quinolinate synthase, chloroplastic-like protein [Drosera capensis]
MKISSPLSPSPYLSFPPNPNPNRTLFSIHANRNPNRTRFPIHQNHRPLTFPLITSLHPIKSTLTNSSSTSTTTTKETVAAPRLRRLVSEFENLGTAAEKLRRVMEYAARMPRMEEGKKVMENRVMGCVAQVWVEVTMDEEGRVRFEADSDSEMIRGFCGCLVEVLDGAWPEEVAGFEAEELGELVMAGGGRERGRGNTWWNVLVAMKKRNRGLVAEREGKAVVGEEFPSLVIGTDGVVAKGSYAEAQAKYLFPDQSTVYELVEVLREKDIGIVAHFYMDPEVQGILTAAQKKWPQIHISDSLVMADKAVKMAEAGCRFIAVLGVDFMAENVRAILDQAGHQKVGVYRMSNERISCSLADAAATPSYMKYLETASLSTPSLHVIYINTSLETKALAHELVPTITCTSSNVVQTILQAFAQVPNLTVYYGPDSYMGANIAELFLQMTMMSDEEINKIHPRHNRASIRSLLPRLHYFQEGTCIVHHLFGHEVVEKINDMYYDAFLTAHLEVPGEMFSLAMEAKRRGMGVVGSTQNILDFIKQRVQEALDKNVNDHLQFVLGTESGMITSIVAAVQTLLHSVEPSTPRPHIKVEIIFPVSSDSVTKTSNGSSDPFKFAVVPGVASGEGCSIHGGCASCPYMKVSDYLAPSPVSTLVQYFSCQCEPRKASMLHALVDQMNSLAALLRVCRQLPDETHLLSAYEAARFISQTSSGKPIADVGCEPILHMRHFQATCELPDKLVHQIIHAHENGNASYVFVYWNFTYLKDPYKKLDGFSFCWKWRRNIEESSATVIKKCEPDEDVAASITKEYSEHIREMQRFKPIVVMEISLQISSPVKLYSYDTKSWLSRRNSFRSVARCFVTCARVSTEEQVKARSTTPLRFTPSRQGEMSPALSMGSKQQPTSRRSGNYPPNIWNYDFLESLASTQQKRANDHDVENRLEEDVRKLVRERQTDQLALLTLIDDIQRLGISHRFQEEIVEALKRLYASNKMNEEDGLHATALRFSLFRQHGFPVSADEEFGKFKDGEGKIMTSLRNDIHGLLNLYEASYYAFEGEFLLDEANAFAQKHLIILKDTVEYRSLADRIDRTLDRPLHPRLPIDEAKHTVKTYNGNPSLRELAKLNFNTTQSMYQNELAEVIRWWRQLDLPNKLGFSRDRMVENFNTAVVMAPGPQDGDCRKTMAKLIAVLCVIDDIYDVYGSLEELKLFTLATERWDVNAIDELPEYMRLTFLAMFNSANEMAYEIMKRTGFNCLPYIKQGVIICAILFISIFRDATCSFNESISERSTDSTCRGSDLLGIIHRVGQSEIETIDVPFLPSGCIRVCLTGEGVLLLLREMSPRLHLREFTIRIQRLSYCIQHVKELSRSMLRNVLDIISIPYHTLEVSSPKTICHHVLIRILLNLKCASGNYSFSSHMQWYDLCKAFMAEAEWYFSKQVPTFKDYLEIGWRSIGGVILLRTAYFYSDMKFTSESLGHLENLHEAIRYSCIMSRVINDWGTEEREQERGDAAKSINCYIHETGASMEDARKHMEWVIEENWKKFNEVAYSDSPPFSKAFLELMANFPRCCTPMYSRGDGLGNLDDKVISYLMEMLLQPV